MSHAAPTKSLLALVLLLLGGCTGGDDPARPGPTPDGPVRTEPGRVVTGVVGFAGGSLQATAIDGTVYTLQIPEGALAEPTTITMTPVSGIEALGLTGGLVGAVQLAPSGLVFARSAILHVATSRTAAAGQRLAAFSANGDFTERALVPVAQEGTQFQVPVPHFTVTGAGFGTTDDLTLFPTFPATSLDGLFAQLLAISTPFDQAGRALAHQIGHDAYHQVVEPALVNALTDADLLDAVSAYDRWRTLLDFIDNGGSFPIVPIGSPIVHRTPSEFTADLDDAAALAAVALDLAIQGNNTLCATQASLTALANVFFWQRQAVLFGIDEVAEGIDLPTVLATLCARPVLLNSSIPSLVQMGFPHSVDIDFGLEFDNGTQIAENFAVTLTGSNLSIQNPTGFTGNATSGIGRYTSVISAPSAGPFSLSARACWVIPNSTVVTDLCGQFPIAGLAEDPPVAVDLTGAWRFGISAFASVHCPVPTSGFANLTQTGNGFTGDWTITHMCGIGHVASGRMNGTLAYNAVEERIDVVRWHVTITSSSNPQVCMGNVSSIELDAPRPLGVNVLTGDPIAVGGTATAEIQLEGCPSTLPVSIGLTFCSRTTCLQ
jgi:hypothetical protein